MTHRITLTAAEKEIDSVHRSSLNVASSDHFVFPAYFFFFFSPNMSIVAK